MDCLPVKYDKFFYSNICHVCKTASKNIKRCSGCKVVAYCCKNHQTADWKYHRKLCKVIAETNKTLPCYGDKKYKNFKDFKVLISLSWKSKLRRKLEHFEEQMWMFPRVCAICFSKEVLLDCEHCLNVSFCSERHKKEFGNKHSKYCSALRLCMDMDLYYFNEKYIPNYVDVWGFDETLTELPNNLEEIMYMCNKGIHNNSLGCDVDDKIQFIIKSDNIAPAATLLYALEKFGLLRARIFPKELLTVHIVGADMTETVWLWKLITELPFHWIRNVNNLNYHIVGPELVHNVTEGLTDQLCDYCQSRERKATITFHSKLYHEIVEDLSEPDIVIAFNSGLHEFHKNMKRDTWKDSISSLTRYRGVPLVLTAYTLNELNRDIDVVKKNSEQHVRTSLEPGRNPFSNMRPIRDWEDENMSVFYINGYIAIVAAVT